MILLDSTGTTRAWGDDGSPEGTGDAAASPKGGAGGVDGDTPQKHAPGGGPKGVKMVQESTFFTRSIGETGFLTPFFVLRMMVLLMSF